MAIVSFVVSVANDDGVELVVIVADPHAEAISVAATAITPTDHDR